MEVTRTRLADGRELLYYDQTGEGVPAVDRSTGDQRDLPPHQSRSEIRRDPLLDQYVIVAAHRQERTHMPAPDECPLCPSRDDHLSEIPATDYQVVVFENRFPALVPVRPGDSADDLQHLAARSVADPEAQSTALTATDVLHASTQGAGRCEVICFTSEHDTSFAALPPERIRLVIEAWCHRTAELSALESTAQVFCFENRGPEIGVTEPHPHGQIYAYPFVTPRTRRMIASARRHRDATGRNLMDDLLEIESTGPRLVAETGHWVAFVPFAARWPYEVHLYPRRRVPHLPSLNTAQRDDLVSIYRDVLARFDRLFGRPAPYVAGWHQAPVRELPERDPWPGQGVLTSPTGFHTRNELALHLEVFTSRRGPEKLKYLAGSEAAMDVFVGDIVPEAAAERLRAVG